MRKMMWVSTFREIRQSIGRYLAVLAIIALGVALFSGLLLTTPFMVETTNQYVQEKELYDFRLLSTYGFEQEDVDRLAKEEDVRCVTGTYSYDVLTYYAPSESTFALKFHGITDSLNELELLAGRLPAMSEECVVDARLFGEDAIGKVLQITDENAKDTLEVFPIREYTITGIVNASYYIQFERGNTSIGNGKLNGFVYVMPQAFDSDVYTEVFVKLNHNLEIYSEAYDAYIEEKETVWEEALHTVAQLRYERIKKQAEEEWDKANGEFKTQKAEGEAELAAAKQELDDGWTAIVQGKKEISQAETEILTAEQEIADGTEKIAEGKKEIETNQEKLAAAKQEIADGYTKFEESKRTMEEQESQLQESQALLIEKEEELNEVAAQWQTNQNVADAAREELQSQEAAVEEQEEEIAALEEEVEELERAMRNGTVNVGDIPATLTRITRLRMEITEGKTAVALARRQIAAGYEQLEESQAQLDAAKEEITIARVQLNEKKAQLEAGERELAQGKAQMAEALDKLKAAEAKVADGEAQLEQAKQEMTQGEEELALARQEVKEAKEEVAKARKELEEAEQSYEDGLREYEAGEAKFQKEIAKAVQELADARKEIDKIDGTDCFLLGRDTNVGYVCMQNDSQIVSDVAAVLPVFFFLIAALVCMTTMNRMVEEQRTQIGVLKALGYSNPVIMGKYLFYSGSAAGIGCVLGFLLGTYALPKIIWSAYQMMYDMGDLVCYMDWSLFFLCLFVSLLCSMGTTWVSCCGELFDVAAVLMRPKAPKTGKRVFLEKIPWIWNHLGFLVKVSIRNVFRYKKRFFMMVVGISGCMALLVTGFGIEDSIADITSIQYDEIMLYDVSVSLKEDPADEVREELEGICKGFVTDLGYFMETSLDITANDIQKSISLVVPGQVDTFDSYIHLHTVEGEKIAYPGPGEAVLSHKMAETLGVEIGDTVQLTDENHKFFQVKISGICQNFINNYIFMSEETCLQLWERPTYQTMYLNLSGEKEEAYRLSARLLDVDSVTNVTITEDSQKRFDSMMSSLDYIILLIIGFAAALAFIVLYNLTNINITERIREIATIKVLGFYKKETASYVFRENIALTAIGAVVGLFLGKLFHAYVMSCIHIDIVAFDVRIRPVSYGYSLLLTFVFVWIVNRWMAGKLDRISMTESLKSVD